MWKIYLQNGEIQLGLWSQIVLWSSEHVQNIKRSIISQVLSLVLNEKYRFVQNSDLSARDFTDHRWNQHQGNWATFQYFWGHRDIDRTVFHSFYDFLEKRPKFDHSKFDFDVFCLDLTSSATQPRVVWATWNKNISWHPEFSRKLVPRELPERALTHKSPSERLYTASWDNRIDGLVIPSQNRGKQDSLWSIATRKRKLLFAWSLKVIPTFTMHPFGIRLLSVAQEYSSAIL